MDSSQPFENRLRKNVRHLRKWARTVPTEAFRVYDRDLPDWPFAVDLYGPRAQLVELPRRRAVASGEAAVRLDAAREAALRVLEVPPAHLYVKTRQPRVWGKEQYEVTGRPPEPFVVEEQGLKFEVDLSAHLDTGLFLDHRVTRARVRAEARGRAFLNLFAYTGAFTVYAAAGGARRTVSVDLSNTYLEWAERNLRLNGLWGPGAALVRADVVRWLEEAAAGPERFGLVVLDPPSFSTSKRMAGTFDVQRDHVRLIQNAARLLEPDGVLYFSTPFQGFILDERALRGLRGEELSPRSVPPDFRQKEIHRCWRISLR